MNKFQHLLDLTDGWYDGEGTKYSSEFINNIDNILRDNTSFYNKMFVYPNPEGNIYIEFHDKRLISITITPEYYFILEYIDLNDNFIEEEYNLNSISILKYNLEKLLNENI